jgi:hypothetical protein
MKKKLALAARILFAVPFGAFGMSHLLHAQMMAGMLHCPMSASRETNQRGLTVDTADRALQHDLCLGQLFQLPGEVAVKAIVLAAQDTAVSLIVLPTASSSWQCPPAEAPPLRMRSPVSLRTTLRV